MNQKPTKLPFVGDLCAPSKEHPLGPLVAAEITRSASLIKSSWPAETEFQFKTINLLEPEKSVLLPWLQAERKGEEPAALPRKSFVTYIIKNTVRLFRPISSESGSMC